MPLLTITQLQPFNINSAATFTFANTEVTANISAGNIKTDNLLYANGTAWSFGSSYSNSNVASYLPTYTGQMANALVAGTVYTNAQPNITSIGTLTSLTSGLITATSGGIKVGNIQDPSGTNTISLASGTVTMVGNLQVGTSGTGNVTATYFIGNGSQLTGLPATYSDTNVASYLPTYTGNLSPGNLVVTTSANLGNAGNVIITGGTSGQFLKTDGSGNLTWASTSSGNAATVTYTPAFKGAMLNASATTSLGANAWTKVALANVVYDSTGGTLTGTASRITIPAGVTKVQLFGSVNTSSQTDQVLATIYKNGASLQGSTDTDIDSTGGDTPPAFTAVIPVTQGDYFELWAFTQLARDVTASNFTWLSIQIVEGSILNTTVSTTIGMSTLSDVDVTSNAPANGQLLAWNSSSSKWVPGNTAITATTVTVNSQPNITSIGTLSSLTVSGTSTLGNVGNVKITGGSSSQLLQTDGTGNISWVTPTGTTITVDNFTGNGVETSYTLTATPVSEAYTMVALAGTIQPRSIYSVTGTTLTFSSPPPDTAPIEVTTFSSVMGFGNNDMTINVLTGNTITANTLTGNIVSSNSNLTVNTLTANSVINGGSGTPTLQSNTSIVLSAATVVRVSTSPMQFYTCTSTVRDTIAASNGYVIYNTTTNKLQVYANGVWADLH